jgi:hypothetical protein
MVFIEYAENKTENTKHGFGLEKNAQPETEPVLLHEQKYKIMLSQEIINNMKDGRSINKTKFMLIPKLFLLNSQGINRQNSNQRSITMVLC